MSEQQAIQNLLREKLIDIQSKNSKYSLRSYAGKLQINPGALSYILNGKRKVSREMAEKLANRLMLDPQQRSELLNLFPAKRAYSSTSATHLEPRYLEIDAANFKVAAEWEHFAIMSLLKCKGFKSSTSWIAKRLGITHTKVKQTTERLVSLGLLRKNEQGEFTRSQKSYRTTDDVASIAMKKHHEQTLDLAKNSLFSDDVSKRDFTTLTMVMSPQRMARAKELIRQFHDEFAAELEEGESTEVFRLSMQLFQLTKN